jgi:hypothetical protein
MKGYLNMKWLVSFMLIGLTFVHHAGGTDLSDGFLTLKWGQNIDQLTGYKEIYAKAPVRYYTNPSIDHTILGKPISHLVYGFYDNRFFAVYIGIEDYAHYIELKRYITGKYGTPEMTQSAKMQETIYKWKNQKIKIKLKKKDMEDKMKIAFYYKPLANQVNLAQQEKWEEQSIRWLPIEKDKKPKMIPLLEF